MRRTACCWLATLVALLAVWAPGTVPAAAQSGTPAAEGIDAGPTFALHALGEPDGGHFRIELQPGETTELTVVMGNLDDAPIELRTYAADAITLTNGGFGLRDEDDPTSGATTWLDYAPETFTIDPKRSIERVFTVSVPADAQPGQHVTGIALETVEPIAVAGTSFVTQVIRKIIGVSITVPGPIAPAAELGAPSIASDTTGAQIVVPIHNTGNISLRPDGTLTLANADGDVVLTAPIAMRPVYAGDETTLTVAVPPQLSPGDYTLDLQLEDTEKGWSATLDSAELALAEPAAPDEPDPVEITAATVTPMPAPAAGEPPQYADVAVEITNRAGPVRSSRLTMVVARDGETVEEVVLSDSLALLEPTTSVERPWIPKDGWQAGTWTFSLQLVSVDPDTGVEAVLATLDVADEIVVP
jgi:hypothetical protein